MKFAKKFFGCRAGEIYPEWFEPGQECPAELVDAAKQLGALQSDEPQEAEASKRVSRKTKEA